MIILTGASGGIGKEMLQYLSKLDDIIAIYNSSIPVMSQVNNTISFQKVDLNNENEIKDFVKNNLKKLKNISLIHAAGVSESSLAINHSKKMWETAIGINLMANFLLTKEIIPLMITERWGRIVHFSSIRVSAGTLSYTTTKHGLIGMSKVLAREYAKFNITSNSLVLGAFNTGMFEDLKNKVKDEMINQIPSKKLGDVKDIVNAIKFILNSSFVNGSTITIDGGASV